MLILTEHKPKRPRPDYRSIYMRILDEKARIATETHSASLRPQLIYFGVKWIGSYWATMHEQYTNEEIDMITSVREVVLVTTARLTPRQFMNIFPIEKTYNGKRYGAKDYFSTMDALQAIGLNTEIGIHAEYVLDNYCNRDIFRYGMTIMSAMIECVRRQTGKDLFVDWLESNGVTPHYLEYDPETGKELMRNSKTGEAFEVQRKTPRNVELLYERIDETTGE